MPKQLWSIVVLMLFAVPLTGLAAEVSFFGYGQLTAEIGEGVGDYNVAEDDYTNDGLQFGADRVRIGYSAKEGRTFGKLQIDFNRSDISDTSKIGVPEIIKDALAGYDLNKDNYVQLGVFKTPVGMDFNISGKKLDITKRGMEKSLVLERSIGLMFSGRNIGAGFGYDIGIFDPTRRSGAVQGGDDGEHQAAAGRIMWDKGGAWHVEASYGYSEKAGANADGDTLLDSEDYRVYDIGARYRSGPLTAKAEYINGTDVRGVDGDDETVWYIHGGYLFTEAWEGVIRHYQGNHEDPAGNETDLGNTYIGVNYFMNKYSRLQVDFVYASGDVNDDKDPIFDGIDTSRAGRYTANALLAQYQYAF